MSILKKVKEQDNYEVMRRSVSLPPELLYKIFNYLTQSQQSLYVVSLVCKQWLRCVAPILYSHPRVKDTYCWATLVLTLIRDKASFFYGDLIRSIDLSSGKSIEAMKDQEFYKRLSDANESRTTVRIRSRRYPVDGEQDFMIKGLPYIIVSTSSLIQLANTCKNLTCINLSYTSLLHDSIIAETGEYASTLQHHATQPGLTHIQIPIKEAIQTLGNQCLQLKQVKIQRCEWVTAHVIWMFVYYCPNLVKLDARRSTKCTVKRLISYILEVHPPEHDEFAIPKDEIEEQEEEEEEEDEEDDENTTIHFIINETTGLYEQVNLLRPTDLLRQLTDTTTWSFSDLMDDTLLERKKTLKDLVQHIILDAKHFGAMDLNWIHDY